MRPSKVLLLPALVFLILFLVAPLGVVIYYSLQPSDLTNATEASLGNYAYLMTKAYFVDAILRTMRLALLSTIASVIIGYATSYVLRTRSERLGSTAILLLAFPILSGPIVTVMGWMIMLTSGGVVGRSIALVREALSMPEQSTSILGTDTAVLIGLVHFSLGFVVLNLLDVLRRIDPTLEEAAVTLGANPWQVFRRITFPLSVPGVFSASLISFALGMNAFVNPLYLGNRSRYVLTTLASQYMTTTYNWQFASATSSILLAISLVTMLTYSRLLRRTNERS